MKQRREELYLVHIVECMNLLPEHMSLLAPGKKWHEHNTVREAVLRTLQVMSESCQKLSAETKAAMPEIDWRKISGFRNVLAHDYLGEINCDLITLVMEERLPELKISVERYYQKHYG